MSDVMLSTVDEYIKRGSSEYTRVGKDWTAQTLVWPHMPHVMLYRYEPLVLHVNLATINFQAQLHPTLHTFQQPWPIPSKSACALRINFSI